MWFDFEREMLHSFDFQQAQIGTRQSVRDRKPLARDPDNAIPLNRSSSPFTRYNEMVHRYNKILELYSTRTNIPL